MFVVSDCGPHRKLQVGALPCCHSVDRMDQITRKLVQLKPLSYGRLIEDVIRLGVEPGEVCIEQGIGLNTWWRRCTWQLISSVVHPIHNSDPQADLPYLFSLGVYTAASGTSATRVASTSGRDCDSLPSPLLAFAANATVEEHEDDDNASSAVGGALSDVGVAARSFFSFNLASSPSTLFNRASSTSVLGPLFLGTASACETVAYGQPHCSLIQIDTLGPQYLVQDVYVPYMQGHWNT